MEKPISVKIKEFKNDMVNLINSTGLPLIMIEPILKEVTTAVETKVEQQYLQDKIAYEQSLKQENNKPEGDKND